MVQAGTIRLEGFSEQLTIFGKKKECSVLSFKQAADSGWHIKSV